MVDLTSGYRIFISYSRKDESFVDSLSLALQARGHSTRIDRTDISTGEAWRDRLEQMIRECDVVLIVLSPDFVTSSICAWEVQRALDLGKRILPLLWRSVPTDRFPIAIAALNFVLVGDGTGILANWDRDKAEAVQKIEQGLNLEHILWTREHTKWIARAADWEALGQSEGMLLRSREISAIQAWIARRPPSGVEVPSLVEVFVAASLAKEEADRRELEIREQRIIERTQRYFGALARKATEEGRFEAALRLAIAGIPSPNERARGFGVHSYLEVQLRRAAHNSRVVFGVNPAPEGAFELKFSPDDQLLAVSCRDGIVRVFPLNATNDIQPFSIAAGPTICGAGFTPDSAQVFTYGEDGACVFWSFEGTEVARLEHGGKIRQAGPVAREGELFFTAGIGDVKVWFGTKLVQSFSAEIDLEDAQFSKSGVFVVARDWGEARVYKLGEASAIGRGYAERAMSDRETLVRSIAISESGNRFAIGCSDELAYTYDLTTGAKQFDLSHFTLREGCTVTAMEFFTDGRLLVTGCNDGYVRVWDCETGQSVYEHAFGKIVLGLCIRRFDTLYNGPKVVVWTADGTIHYLEFTEAGRLVDFVSAPTLDSRPDAVAVSNRQRELVAVLSPRGQLGVWRAPNRRSWDSPHIRSRNADIVFDPDSDVVRSCLRLRRDPRELMKRPDWAERVEPASESLRPMGSGCRFTGDAARFGTIQIVSYDEQLAVTVASDGIIRAIDPADQSERFAWQLGASTVSLRLSPTTRYLLVQTHNMIVHLLSTATGERLASYQVPTGRDGSWPRFDISPDDRLLTLTIGAEIQVRRLLDGDLIAEFDRVLDLVRHSNFLPGLPLVASSGHHGGVLVWDADSGQLLETFSLRNARPYGVSADRSFLIVDVAESSSRPAFSGWRVPRLLGGGPLGLAVTSRAILFGLEDEGGTEQSEIAAIGIDDGSLIAKGIDPREVEEEARHELPCHQAHHQH
jgi:WD40 repeat protein